MSVNTFQNAVDRILSPIAIWTTITSVAAVALIADYLSGTATETMLFLGAIFVVLAAVSTLTISRNRVFQVGGLSLVWMACGAYFFVETNHAYVSFLVTLGGAKEFINLMISFWRG